MESGNANQKLMVYIDYENISISARQLHLNFDYRDLERRLRERGRILATYAYGDFTGAWYEYHRQALLETGVQQVHLARCSTRSQKNRADIRLAIDATVAALTRAEIDGLVIASGDGDLSELAITLRAMGKVVIGAAYSHSTSTLLRNVCDEFLELAPTTAVQAGRSCHSMELSPQGVGLGQGGVIDREGSTPPAASIDLRATIANTLTAIRREQAA